MYEDFAKDFLSKLEARDLEGARAFLAPDFKMTFPGGATMDTLEQLVEWSRLRYRSVAKRYDHFEEIQDGDTHIVYCMGWLDGKALDGSSFTDVRFLDRFEISNGKIKDQQVWNDLGEFL